MRTRKRKKSKRWLSEKQYLRRILSVYFAAHIVVFAAFSVLCGVSLAKRGSEQVWFGAEEDCIFMDDLNKWLNNLKEDLYFYYNNAKIVRQFEIGS